MQRIIHIEAPPPNPPLPATCVRLKTNQFGEVGLLNEPLEDVPGSGTWTGATSGATGVHQRYFYEDEPTGIPGTEQQYIVVDAVVGGPFVADEALTGA